MNLDERFSQDPNPAQEAVEVSEETGVLRGPRPQVSDETLLRGRRKPRPHDGTIIPEAPDRLWGTDATMAYTRDDGWVWAFVAVDHHTAEAWTAVAKRGDRFAATEPICDAVRQRFTFPERELLLQQGEVLLTPGGMPHSAEMLEDCVTVDFFSPPRQDWIAGADAYLRE